MAHQLCMGLVRDASGVVCASLMLKQFVQMTFAALIVKPSPYGLDQDTRQANYFREPEMQKTNVYV